MNKTELLTLFDYTYWAHRRVLDAAARLAPEQYAIPAGAGELTPHSSLHGTLVHMFAAERTWRQRCQGRSPTSLPTAADFPSLAELRTAWQVEGQAMRAFLAACSDADLLQTVQYRTTTGVAHANPLWQLLHVVNHGTQHRAEAAMLLTAAGGSPGDLDLIVYLRAHADQASA